jgi:ribulose bisphosphate carboxylase small subunit
MPSDSPFRVKLDINQIARLSISIHSHRREQNKSFIQVIIAFDNQKIKVIHLFIIDKPTDYCYIMAAQSNAFSAYFAFAKSGVTLSLHCCHPP